jgi:hypothetical protein
VGYFDADSMLVCRPEPLTVLEAGFGGDKQQNNDEGLDFIVLEAKRACGSEEAFQEAVSAWRQEEQETQLLNKHKHGASSQAGQVCNWSP